MGEFSGENRTSVARTLFATGAAVTVGGLPTYLVSAMAVQIGQELGLTVAMVGAATALFFTVAALTSRPLSRLTERIGPTAALRLAALSTGACALGMAAAPSIGWLLVGVGVAGMANSLAQPATAEVLVVLIPGHRKAFAFGAKQAAVPVGSLLAGLTVPAVALTMGWRWGFVLCAVLAVTTALAAPRVPARTTRADASRIASTDLFLLATAAALAAGTANAMAAYIVVTAVDSGLGPAGAGLMLSLGSATSVASRLLVGLAADRWRPDLLVTAAVMIALGAVGLGLFAVGGTTTFLVGLILGFAAGWAWAGVFNLAVADRFPDRVTSATSVTQVGVYVGSATMPPFFGWCAQTFGLAAAWSVTGVAMLAAAGLLVSVRRRPGNRFTAPPRPPDPLSTVDTTGDARSRPIASYSTESV
ncbi:MFS family permease [Saccharothrix tamanrassetensis]|uniref:MFS family permease n=1 Tax=Saccharothrix tamanrassetensis TaxID=1051531 RepID=A0A841CM40_9PSEU|nr:MFS transporter [Saccharothrix tamanrassetensis]MBB5957157.1 MFS family permease [Saccharothrix tamanrassetensis]